MDQKEIFTYFEDQAQMGHWDTLYDPKNPISYWFIIRLRKAIELIPSFSRKSVLDVGCGTGALIPFVIEGGGNYVGVDISEKMLKEVERVHPEYYKNDKVNLVVSDFINLKIEEKFDVIMGLGFIEYFDKPEQIITKLGDQLGSGKALVLTFPNNNSLDYLMLNLFSPFRYLIRKLFNKSTPQPPRQLWSVDRATKMMSDANFKNIKVVNYNVNIFTYPFTKISVSFTNFWARIFEYSFLSRFSFFSTGFIIYCEKP